MRKKVMLLFVFLIFSAVFVQGASSDHAADINKAFMCLDTRVSATTLSLEEAVFAALAGTPNIKINTTINQAKSSTEFCWPAGSCTVKQTAQVALAKLHMGERIDNITTWLKTQTGVARDLTWYLQIVIDNNGAAQCKVNYKGADYTISVSSDMFLSGNPGTCLSFANPSYRLKISNTCLEEEFSVQCDQSFKTNLLYEKSTEGTLFVSPDTHGASAGAWTDEKITAQCFTEGTTCNYEASLWAASALYANGEDIKEYAPYLRALAFENKKYFPSAFLVALFEGREEHYSEIIESQKIRPEGAYWEMAFTPYNKYYDTALGMLALGGADSPEINSANTLGYLFENQDDSGCWNSGSIRDTAFLIYAARWMRSTTPQPPVQPFCGDGIVNGGEVCDGTNLDGSNCTARGYASGTLGCYSNCTFNVAQCLPVQQQVCGDGVISGSEVCDCGADGNCTNSVELGGQTCLSKGYSNGGILGCSAGCASFNVSMCSGSGGPGPPGGGNNNGSTNHTNSSGGGGYNPNLITDCELANLFCAPSMSACREVGGSFFPQSTHSCENHLEYCCTVAVDEPTCASLGGTVCAYDQPCEGSPRESRDGPCCVSPYACSAPLSGSGCSSNNDCSAGEVCISGRCQSGVSSECTLDSDCNSDEECSDGNCVAKESNGSSLWIWITVFAILIVLIIVAIVYRDRLRVWWMRRTGKVGSSKIPPRGPPPGTLMERRPPPRFGPPGMATGRPGMAQSIPSQRASVQSPQPVAKSKDAEAEETLRKLKEMSK